MQIVLGSSSKYRQQIMREHGFDFIVMKPDIDERVIVPDGIPISHRSQCDPGQVYSRTQSSIADKFLIV